MNGEEEYFVDEIEINGQSLELSGDMSVEYDHMEHDHRRINLIVP